MNCFCISLEQEHTAIYFEHRKDIVTRCHNIFVLSLRESTAMLAVLSLRESTASIAGVATLAGNKAGV